MLDKSKCEKCDNKAVYDVPGPLCESCMQKVLNLFLLEDLEVDEEAFVENISDEIAISGVKNKTF